MTDDFWVETKTPLYDFVPYWLKFDSEYNEFYGIPEVEDYKYFKITVTASDITGSISDTFVMKVSNVIPFLNGEIRHEVPKGRVDSGYEYILDENTFKDPENDALTFKAKKLPDWLEFDAN